MTETGEKSEKPMSGEFAMAEGEYHIVTDIWTINLEGKLLLTQRHPNKTFGLWWECTGGSAQAGETSLDSVLRERLKKSGIHPRPEEVRLMHSTIRPDRFVDTQCNGSGCK